MNVHQDIVPIAQQVALALAYYLGIVVMVRLAGKRLAGQVTSFDLIVLIGLAVVAQKLTLGETRNDALVFMVTVLAIHRLLAALAARFTWVRVVLRGRPRTLIADGAILHDSLRAEGLSESELRAGLRKLGIETPALVKLAVLEETGHISAIPIEGDAAAAR